MHQVLLLLGVVLGWSASVFGQTDTTQMATIYIVRPSKVGMAINFRYFVDSTYVGKCNYGKYVRVEVPPGHHRIWAKAEGFSFVTAELEAGKTYLLEARPSMGLFYSNVTLRSVSRVDNRKVDRAVRCLQKHRPLVLSTEELAEGQSRWQNIIARAAARQAKDEVEGIVYPLLTEALPLREWGFE